MRAAIVLAAGASRRFGRRDKLAARIGARSLLDHAIANAAASGARRIILVSAKPQHRHGLTCVRVRDAGRGLSASLAAGLRALRPIEREAFIFLADMPFARAGRMQIQAGYDAVRPFVRGRPGHPVLVRAAVAAALLGSDDRGLIERMQMGRLPGGEHNLIDVDTPAALHRARLKGSYRFGQRSRAI